MMNDKYMNPLHSPHLQAAIQLRRNGYTGDIEDIADQLEEESVSNPEKIKKMNDEWNATLYASKSIDHLMLSVLEYCPAIHKTSPEAQAILLLMIRTQEQATGLVELQKGIYAKVLGWGSKRAARIKDYLQELKDIKIIAAIYEPPKGSSKPGIYKINHKFSKIGKGFKVGLIGKTGEYVRHTSTVTMIINGKRQDLKCGSIQKIIVVDNDKKNDVSAGHTDTTTEPYTGSALQDDSNRKGRKNQVSDTVNMQNNCDILTPEENNLFSGTLAGGTKNEASANQ